MARNTAGPSWSGQKATTSPGRASATIRFAISPAWVRSCRAMFQPPDSPVTQTIVRMAVRTRLGNWPIPSAARSRKAGSDIPV